MSREALGDAPPDALEGARSGDAPAATAMLGTVTIGPRDHADGPPTRAITLRPPVAPVQDPARNPAHDPAHNPTHHPAGDLDLDLGDPGGDDGPPSAATPAGTSPGRRRPRVVTAVAATALLVVGALAGATSARQQAQAQLDASARVVLAVHLDQNGFFSDGSSTQTGDVLQFVDVSMTGSLGGADAVKIEKVRTPLGTFEVYAPVTTADGKPATRTLLKGTVDCDRANALKDADAITGHVLAGSTAVVRPVGSRVDVEVPVVVPNPDAPMSAMDQRCNPQNYVGSDGPSYSVGALVAHADGSLDFVASPGTAVPLRSTPARLSLVTFSGGEGPNPFVELHPTKESGDSATYTIPDTRWSVTVSPALPLVVERPTLVQVRFTYFCRRGFRSSASTPPPLPVLPQVSMGTVSSTGTVNPYTEGWDDAVMQNAMTAAAVNGCARP